jgi:gluconolactonase
MEIIKFSDKLDHIIHSDISLEKLTTGFVFVEGPVWLENSNSVLFTDFSPHQIFKWNGKEGVSIYREDSGRSVGMAIDLEGNILCCETSKRRVSRMEKDGSVTTVASHYEEKRLNSPNDVIVKSDGTLYFTDPYSVAMGDTRDLLINGVFKVSPVNGEVTLLEEFNRPNGLAFSPDEKLLYISDTNLQNVQVFDVTEDGNIANGRLFVQLDTSAGKGNADGMKVDSQGNIYVTGPGGIWVIAPDGEKLGILKFPEVAANLCWGGRDARTLYVTATSSLYRVQLRIPGVPAGTSLQKGENPDPAGGLSEAD